MCASGRRSHQQAIPRLRPPGAIIGCPRRGTHINGKAIGDASENPGIREEIAFQAPAGFARSA
jgi:hypothetical protein